MASISDLPSATTSPDSVSTTRRLTEIDGSFAEMIAALEDGESYASWMIPGKLVPGMGGAMDLVQGVKHIYVITQHTTRHGDPKLVETCSYPLTGKGVVSRIFTDLAVVDVTPEGFKLVELAPGISFEEVQEKTGAPILPLD